MNAICEIWRSFFMRSKSEKIDYLRCLRSLKKAVISFSYWVKSMLKVRIQVSIYSFNYLNYLNYQSMSVHEKNCLIIEPTGIGSQGSIGSQNPGKIRAFLPLASKMTRKNAFFCPARPLKVSLRVSKAGLMPKSAIFCKQRERALFPLQPEGPKKGGSL